MDQTHFNVTMYYIKLKLHIIYNIYIICIEYTIYI